MVKPKRRFKGALPVLTLVMAGILFGLLSFQPLEKYDQMALDYFFALRGQRKEPKRQGELPPAVVVAVDAKTLEEVGRWPWPRGVLARLMYIVCMGEPSTVVLDVLLDRATNDYSRWYAQEDGSFDPKKTGRNVGPCPGVLSRPGAGRTQQIRRGAGRL